MRFKRRMELEYGLKAIAIAPLISVVFLLLFFFMLTSSFVPQGSIPVTLPLAVTSDMVGQDTIEVMLLPDQAIALNGRNVDLVQLKSALTQVSRRNIAVLIKADRSAALASVAAIWDMCRDAGIKKINIATSRSL